MDPVQTIGGPGGLRAIASALRKAGRRIDGVYLVNAVIDGDYGQRDDWVVRIVSNEEPGDLLLACVLLQREGRIPQFGKSPRISVISPEEPEAARILSYARSTGRLPVEFGPIGLDGVFVDFALVADIADIASAAA